MRNHSLLKPKTADGLLAGLALVLPFVGKTGSGEQNLPAALDRKIAA
ncbi:MAG: hypothetical protein ACRES9_07620 [Gammaproteobacteria bacterium]